MQPVGIALDLAFRTVDHPALPTVKVTAEVQQQAPLALSMCGKDLADVLGILDHILVSEATVNSKQMSGPGTVAKAEQEQPSMPAVGSGITNNKAADTNDDQSVPIEQSLAASRAQVAPLSTDASKLPLRSSLLLTLKISSAHLTIYQDDTDVVRLELMESKARLEMHDYDKTLELRVGDLSIVDLMAGCDLFRYLLERIHLTPTKQAALALSYKVSPWALLLRMTHQLRAR
jgi:hypothetical protein